MLRTRRSAAGRSGRGVNGKLRISSVKATLARPKEPIPGSRTLWKHQGPSLEKFQSSLGKSSRDATKGTPPPRPRSIRTVKSRPRGSSAQLPGSPWRRARCRRAPREGQPVVGVERPNGPLRRAYEASSPSSRARAAQLPLRLPAPRVLQPRAPQNKPSGSRSHGGIKAPVHQRLPRATAAVPRPGRRRRHRAAQRSHQRPRRRPLTRPVESGRRGRRLSPLI